MDFFICKWRIIYIYLNLENIRTIERAYFIDRLAEGEEKWNSLRLV